MALDVDFEEQAREFGQATERRADTLRAEKAFERADAWARSCDGRTYAEMFPKEDRRDDSQ